MPFIMLLIILSATYYIYIKYIPVMGFYDVVLYLSSRASSFKVVVEVKALRQPHVLEQ